MEEREDWWRGRGENEPREVQTSLGSTGSPLCFRAAVEGGSGSWNQQRTKCFSWKSSLEGNRSEGGGEGKAAAGRKGKTERRGERGAEPFTLFSDQRTEYRLETEEREKCGE